MKGVLILLFMLITHFTYASVVLERTRLIFPTDNSIILLQVFNQSEQSTLIQSWVDEGNVASTPETTTAPFIVIPPMAKMTANGGLQLKIQQLENRLPKDRESVFYLNVLDIAPKPENKENFSTLQLALQTRIKLFYRPAQLKLTTEDVFKQIEITHHGEYLAINNPTAYYFTISKMYFDDKEALLTNAIMVAPFAKQHIQYQKQTDMNQVITVIYIDDDGNYQQDKKNIH
ncbi:MULTISPECIES: fimbrial biogenesis chaperone [Proteus]|uniref:Molecular chaperone n=1 Tax=Proteus appendicitidis TaxID=3034648 RepID=A0ABY8Y3B2_9GAMM|nr:MULTISPECIES: molecular chaperone [unclassified Proteus (in: enterobacteria)]QEZ92412.1 pili assembly chaperone [Proteus sp. CD3]WIV86897.1 molecular chaperone [Proteus sp. HZ0627]